MKSRNHPLAPPPSAPPARPVRASMPAPTAPPAPLTARTLQDLKTIQQQLARQQKAQAEQAQAALAARTAAWRAQHLFASSIGAVTPLAQGNQAPITPTPVPPVARQHLLDEQRVLHESLSDGFDVSTLLETDDLLSFRRPGVGMDVIRRLRKGEWSLQRQLDLHGMRTDEARQALGQFIRQAVDQGIRCVRVVHGKGLGSPGKTPVLKSRVHSWLVQKNEILAFVQARGDEGGAGALVVLLRSSRSKRPNAPASN